MPKLLLIVLIHVSSQVHPAIVLHLLRHQDKLDDMYLDAQGKCLVQPNNEW